VPPEVDAEHYESILYTGDKLEVPVEIYLIRGFSLGGETDLSFVYIRDLSERKRVEQYAIQAEKMFALGQLSSSIAHEIRNPLFALGNNIDYLKRRFEGNATFEEIYPELRDGIDRLHRIVSAILDFARSHPLEFKEVVVDEIIEKSLTLVKKQFEKSAIRIETRFEDGHGKVEADPHQLEQVFVNLFLNAFQAMERTGILRIRTRALPDYMEVTIEDTGRGIPEEEIPRIFDPFYSKFPGGTGLGLAIVQRILEQHDAAYRVTSKVGLGTVFQILLRYRQEQLG
jgi:two-component system sensor histidine kinase HydH